MYPVIPKSTGPRRKTPVSYLRFRSGRFIGINNYTIEKAYTPPLPIGSNLDDTWKVVGIIMMPTTFPNKVRMLSPLKLNPFAEVRTDSNMNPPEQPTLPKI